MPEPAGPSSWDALYPGGATGSNFRAFFEAVTDVLLVGDLDGRVIYANPAATTKLGYTPAQLASMHILDLHPQSVRPEAEDIFSKMFRGELDSCPLPLQSASGALVPVETRVWLGEWDGRSCVFGISKDLSREQEALQRFDRLFRSNPLPMALSDMDLGVFVDVNRAFTTTLGYSRDEILGKSTRDLHLWLDPDAQAAVARQLVERGSVAEAELQVRRADGQVLEGVFSGEIIHTQGSTYALTVMIDMTERIRVHREFLHSENLLHGLAKATQRLLSERELTEVDIAESLGILGTAVGVDRVYIFEQEDAEDGSRGYCSQRYEWASALAEPQIDNPDLQRIPWELVAPRWYDTFVQGGFIAGDVDDFPDNERAALEPQDVRSVLVLPIHLHDRLWGFIGFDACTATREWDSAEVVLLEAAASGFAIAIERERLQQQLAASAAFHLERADASEARFRTIFEQAPLGIVTVDTASGRFTEANLAYCALVGRDEDALRAISFWDIVPPADTAALRSFTRLVVEEVGVARMEHRLVRPDGSEVTVSVTAVLQRGTASAPDHIVGIVEDITERRRAASAMLDAQMSMIYALAKLAESRDDDTGKHLERVQHLCRALAEEVTTTAGALDDEFVELLFNAAPLHDVGKVGVPDAILLKPGRLTPDEFEIAKTHAVIGAETLAAVRGRYPNNDFINMGIDVALYHHERWDGGGYPEGLAGEDIPLAARIMAVADVYEALRSVRCYKAPVSHEEAVRTIAAGADTQFDPAIVEAFLRVADEFERIWGARQV